MSDSEKTLIEKIENELKLFEKIEDELDMKLLEEAREYNKKHPERYTLEEVRRELGLTKSKSQ